MQAVCDRIIIINKGKLVADEKTENINRAVDDTFRYRAKICGPQREVLNMLNARPDIARVELADGRDGDAYIYTLESARGVDMRKGLFHALAQRSWPLVGLEPLGMSLEDVFLSIVDKTSDGAVAPAKSRRQSGKGSKSIENDLAQSILDATAEQQKNVAPYEGDDD